MIPAICIDDKNKPSGIDQSEWVKEGNKYTITHIFYHPEQGVQGVHLKEVRLTEKSQPYETYRISRFAISVNDLQKFIELMKICTELNDLDISKLIEQEELVTVEK